MGTDRVKLRILIPLTVAIVGLLGAFVAGAFRLKHNSLDAQISQYLCSVENVLRANYEIEIQSLEKMLDNLQNHKVLLEAYDAQDNDAFHEAVTPVFRELSRNHDISGLTFYNADGSLHTRLCRAVTSGGTPEHITLAGAIETGQPVFGMELSHSGLFSLSYVAPWQKEGQVVGYVEVEKDQSQLSKDIPTAFDVNLVTFIDKSYLDRESWERQYQSRRGVLPWDSFADFAVVDNSFDGPLPFNDIRLLSSRKDATDIPAEVLSSGHEYALAFFPLVDDHSRTVGYTAIFYNAGPFLRKTRDLLYLITALCVIIGLALFISFYKMLDTLEHKLSSSRQKMTEEHLLRLEIERRHTRELAAHVLELELARTRALNLAREAELAKNQIEEARQRISHDQTRTIK